MHQADAFVMYFRFDIFWNFLALNLASSLWVMVDQLTCLVQRPIESITTIALQWARNADFFMFYLALQVYRV